MRKLILFLLAFAGILLTANAQMKGDWGGELQLGTQKLNVIFHFSTDSSGLEKCALDVPAQGAKGIPVEILHNAKDSVSLTVKAILAKYSGKMNGKKMEGIFSQSGYTFPLDLETIVEEVIKRPQTPVAPFPYTTKEVTFENKHDSVKLGGTLTYPIGYKEGDKAPIVLFVTGSGQQNRDEELFEHKPFAVIADYLARHGIASLRYDDRGIGSSTGVFKGKTSVDFARDAESGIAYLKSLNQFSQVGIIGHSEGGQIAFMLGSKKIPDFIVTLGAPGIKGDSLIVEQSNKQLQLQGLPAELTVQMVRTQFMSMGDAWMNYFMDYDPTTAITKTDIPVFALNGELDTQVLYESNLGSIRRLLPNNPKNKTKSYPSLNHLFQHAVTGGGSEYYEIEETISAEVLEDIVEWIQSL